MITIENESVKVHVKSIVFDRGTGNQVYWMTAVGPKVAMQSVFASLVNKKTVTIEGIEIPQTARPWDHYRRYRSRENTVTVPYDGKMHAVYKKLQSGLSAMVMYSSLARTDDEENSHGAVVLLCRESEDKKAALFHFLNSKVKIPLCEEWKDWVWDVVSKSESNLRQLEGYGMVGFHLMLDSCETAIEKAIGPAIKKGVIKK